MSISQKNKCSSNLVILPRWFLCSGGSYAPEYMVFWFPRVQTRAIWGGVRKRNSSAFTFRAHNWIKHMFNVSWFTFMSAKGGKIREREQKRSSLKWKIHVHLHLHTMIRTGLRIYSFVNCRTDYYTIERLNVWLPYYQLLPSCPT